MEHKIFTTKTEAKDLFRFQIYHTYFGITGVLLGLLAVLATGDLIGNFTEMSTGTKVICILLVAWAVVLNPVNLYFKAKKQAKTVELFKNPIDTEITEEGISMSQGENGGLVEWKDVTKIVILKTLVIFYLGKVRAHLLPLEQLGEADADEAVELIKKYGVGKKIVNKRKKRRK